MSMTNSIVGPVDLLIFQSTSFCNLDCKYCYLPDRSSKVRMDINIIRQTLQNLVKENLLGDTLNLLWHAGEPTVMPLEFYESVSKLVSDIIPEKTKVLQQIQ